MVIFAYPLVNFHKLSEAIRRVYPRMPGSRINVIGYRLTEITINEYHDPRGKSGRIPLVVCYLTLVPIIDNRSLHAINYRGLKTLVPKEKDIPISTQRYCTPSQITRRFSNKCIHRLATRLIQRFANYWHYNH